MGIKFLENEKSILTKSLQGLNDLRISIIDTHSKYLKYPNTEILGGIVYYFLFVRVKPRKKRVGRYYGLTNRKKKAIVTLKEGSSIELN